MSDTAIKIEGLERLIGKVSDLRELKPIKDGLKLAAIHVKGAVSEYPPVKRPTRRQVYGFQFFSTRQRRAFFAKLRAGEIEVPYIRGMSAGSESLGRKWTTKVTGLQAEIGNNVSYGPLVQDREQQSLYHQWVGWSTIQDISEREADAVNGFLQEKVDLVVNQ